MPQAILYGPPYEALIMTNPYYVYVLLSKKDNKFYIGYTNNIEKRLKEHENGEVASTKWRLPVMLIYYEMHLNQKDALRREDYFKTTAGKRTIKIMLRYYLKGLVC